MDCHCRTCAGSRRYPGVVPEKKKLTLATEIFGGQTARGTRTEFPIPFGNRTPSQKVKQVQAALNRVMPSFGGPYQLIAEDGLFGPQTLTALEITGWSQCSVAITEWCYKRIVHG